MAINENDLQQWRLIQDEKVRELNVRVANLEQDIRHLQQIAESLAFRVSQQSSGS